MTQPTPLRILQRARAILRRGNGWTKHTYRSKTNSHYSYCSLGAIAQAWNELTGSKMWDPDALIDDGESSVHKAQAILGRIPLVHYFVADWNDTPSRTKKEVLEGFGEAIAAAKKAQ